MSSQHRTSSASQELGVLLLHPGAHHKTLSQKSLKKDTSEKSRDVLHGLSFFCTAHDVPATTDWPLSSASLKCVSVLH